MLDVDESNHAALALGFGQDVLAQRRLARRLRAEDLRHAAARYAADAEREVQGDRACGNDVHGLSFGRAEAHDRAPPELLLDGQDCGIYGLGALAGALCRSRPGVCPSVGHRHLAPRSSPGSSRR